MELPEPLPQALEQPPHSRRSTISPALSLFARPGRRQHPHAARRASSSPTASTARRAMALHAGLAAQGAVPRYVGARLGTA